MYAAYDLFQIRPDDL